MVDGEGIIVMCKLIYKFHEYLRHIFMRADYQVINKL